MKEIELNFDEAWAYFNYLIDMGLSISTVAKKTGITRQTLSSAVNGQIEPSTGKPRKLPENHHDTLIEFIKNIQLETWKKEKKKNEQT